ncbi:right-handed parallel beta-helix repeat-containing protein [Micromonospora sp. WMMD967]|uniref:right-handed parallel beta-helix repeat-containing protein n=1 Tax=Micromonospora sp. WMMD967 TaxID=3016101 RepID=UPI0024167452|nr:right-handed parallel beta-helix repeat-containing protein [Micromonospora sp. WMMD967]MDG4836338.1 right-handed parallel beta-helix repeat-containing protein [Micromonospora sp. WMMD967]
MKRAVRSLLALVPLVGAATLVGPVIPAATAAPAPSSASAAPTSTGSELFVSATDCVPNGDGRAESPFCTISAAAAVAQPGQTVLVQPGLYPESVAVTRSGTAAAPITFKAVNTRDGVVRVGRYGADTGTGSVFTLRQVHDVVVEGFAVYGRTEVPVVVDGASRVTVDGVSVTGTSRPLIKVTGGSTDVTISRNFLNSPGTTALAVEGDSTGTMVIANQIPNGGMDLTRAAGAIVTNNTIQAGCAPGITLVASPGVTVANNIVKPLPDQRLCEGEPTVKTAIMVLPVEVPQTTVHHNLIDPTTGWALYRWGATTYRTLGDFQAATGQGAFDIVADPLLDPRFEDRGFIALKQSSPAIDSADANAPGVLATDLMGNAHADDPTWANTGTGNGYHDRGAVERLGPTTLRVERLHRTIGAGPLDTTLRASASTQWTTDGPIGSFVYQYGDSPLWRGGTPSLNENHRFRRAGSACVQVQWSTTGFRSASASSPSCTVLGAHYTAVAPKRLLDTRSAVGVGTSTPVPPKSEVVVPVDSIGGVPAADISALVLNVTATQPTAAGFLTVYPDGTNAPTASNVNFVAGETVPNLVTVPMSNGKIRIRNSSGGTVHVVADLQGWYAEAGDGFATQPLTRVLDTRTDGGALAPNGTRTLNLDRKVSPGATAVVLNVTVTAPTTSGVLKVFPYGSPVPTASNLNFVAGQTIPNLVIVPVTDLKANIHNQSSGSVHVIADLAGYFGVDGQLSYVPNGPLRIADSRDATGLPNRGGAKPLQPWESVNISPYVDNLACCVTAAAVVANLTVTAPASSGFLIAHPGAEARPPVSNLNFVTGETSSNLAIVGTKGGLNLYNSSSGTAHVVADQAGIFVTPQY